MTAGQLPRDRYGRVRTRPSRPWLRVLGMVLAGLLGLLIAVIGYRNLADKPVQGEAISFELLDDNAVSLRLEVVRDDPARPAACIVRARSLDGGETGRKEIYVPPADGPVTMTTVIRTSRPPVTADVYGCSLQPPAYLGPDTAP